jgi:hypothetical protein
MSVRDNAQGDDIGEGCIILYEHCNFEGRQLKLCNDAPSLGSYGFNDLASSIKLGKGTTATLYEDINYGKRQAFCNKDVWCFLYYQQKLDISMFNDLASSVKIGKFAEKSKSSPVVPAIDINNKDNKDNNKDKTIANITNKSEVKPAEQTKIKDPNNFRFGFLENDNKPKNGHSTDNSRGGDKVEDGCVGLYTECDFKGDSFSVCGQESQLGIPNVKSIKFGKNVSAVDIYQYYYGYGQGKRFSQEIKCIDSNIFVTASANSAKIIK